MKSRQLVTEACPLFSDERNISGEISTNENQVKENKIAVTYKNSGQK